MAIETGATSPLPGHRGAGSHASEFDFTPFADFSAAARAILTYLRQRLGFSLWVVARTDGDDWIVLQSKDEHYGIHPGNVLRWSETPCARMVRGLGPHIAPRTKDVPAYTTAELARRYPIEAYVGVPLLLDDGSLFGTLCAYDPLPQPSEIALELPTLKMLARMLSNVLSNELKLAEEARRTERTEVEVDPVTGLTNATGWERVLSLEEERCLRYGNRACVLSIHVDEIERVTASEGRDAAEELLGKAAIGMRNSCRSNDTVARLGEDEFAILAVECDVQSGGRLMRRVERALVERGIKASIGLAARLTTLDKAWHAATDAMSERFRTRSSGRA
jgi:diguanylate cyclase (GGDEF)-like protein